MEVSSGRSAVIEVRGTKKVLLAPRKEVLHNPHHPSHVLELDWVYPLCTSLPKSSIIAVWCQRMKCGKFIPRINWFNIRALYEFLVFFYSLHNDVKYIATTDAN